MERVRGNNTPVVVVKTTANLHTGNSENYPLHPALPRLAFGAELRQLAERGNWLQVQLPGGAVGWIAAAAVVR